MNAKPPTMPPTGFCSHKSLFNPQPNLPQHPPHGQPSLATLADNIGTSIPHTNWKYSRPYRHKNQLYQLEKQMSKCQCKNTFSNIKDNMAPPEHSGPITARSEHPNKESKENDLKTNFMKMILFIYFFFH